MDRMAGKTVLVTGGGLGMGRSHSILLAREGARVAVSDINEDAGESVVEEINSAGGSAVFFKHNVAAADDCHRVVDGCIAEFGQLDVVVNNAGILIMKPLHETGDDEWDSLFNINVKGTFYGCKYTLPALKKAGGGSIVNISSIYGMVGASDSAAYVASKGAVRMMTKAAAIDLAQFNIRVNSVHPGTIETDMTKGLLASPMASQMIEATTFMKRVGQPEEVSAAVLSLASDDSSYVTGSELVVDGGYSAQ